MAGGVIRTDIIYIPIYYYYNNDFSTTTTLFGFQMFEDFVHFAAK